MLLFQLISAQMWIFVVKYLLFFLSSALAMGLCVAMIAFVRLPSLKVSCLLLSGLLIYDVFWVRYAPIQNFTPITADAQATAMRYSKQTVYSRTLSFKKYHPSIWLYTK